MEARATGVRNRNGNGNGNGVGKRNSLSGNPAVIEYLLP